MTHHYRVGEVAAGERATDLSLAIRLVDGVTGERPLGHPSVSVVAPGPWIRPAAVNDSGYWLFLDVDLPPDPLQLVLDGGDWYADDRIERSRSADGPPALSVELAPAPQYPFGRGATVLRGVVVTADETGVSNAVVTVQGLDRRTRTNDSGEFVLSFDDRPVDEDPVTGDRRVTVDGADPVIDVSHDLGNLSAPVTVAAGTVTRHTFAYS